jgi:hypothetical protein
LRAVIHHGPSLFALAYFINTSRYSNLL